MNVRLGALESAPTDSQLTSAIAAEILLPPSHSHQYAAPTSARVSTSAAAPTQLSGQKRNRNSPAEPDIQAATVLLKRRKKSCHAIFRGMAFMITNHPALNNYAWKGNFARELKRGGGLVKPNWEEFFHISLNPQSEGTRSWLETTRANISWTGGEDVQEVLLIADSPTDTQKYLIALALGIPCVSYKWVSDTLKLDNPKVGIILSCILYYWIDRIIPTVPAGLAEVPPFIQQIDPTWNPLLAAL